MHWIYDGNDDTLRYANGAEIPDGRDVWAELDRRGLIREATDTLPRRARIVDIDAVSKELHDAAMAQPDETVGQRENRYRAAYKTADRDRRAKLIVAIRELGNTGPSGVAYRTVTIRDAPREAAEWGHGRGGIRTKTVTVPWVCPVCGGPRGVPFRTTIRDDGDAARADAWNNECGHVDMWEHVIAEAAALALTNDEPSSARGGDRR